MRRIIRAGRRESFGLSARARASSSQLRSESSSPQSCFSRPTGAPPPSFSSAGTSVWCSISRLPLPWSPDPMCIASSAAPQTRTKATWQSYFWSSPRRLRALGRSSPSSLRKPASLAGHPREPGQLILATATVVLSWAFIHSIFALHYAHEFYGEGRDRQKGGMSFPDDNEPDYWDFAYFAFTIGMCAQVSDVTVSSKSIRRTVLTHSIVSFLFNAALLALTVNIAASAI